jgi:hypothetical protein
MNAPVSEEEVSTGFIHSFRARLVAAPAGGEPRPLPVAGAEEIHWLQRRASAPPLPATSSAPFASSARAASTGSRSASSSPMLPAASLTIASFLAPDGADDYGPRTRAAAPPISQIKGRIPPS